MKRALPICGILVAAFVAVAIGVARSGGSTSPKAPGNGGSKGTPQPVLIGDARPVQDGRTAPSRDGETTVPFDFTAPLDSLEVNVVARSLGKLESASEEIGVASDLTGRIVAILVEEGDQVAAGQPLVQLDDTVYRARVGAAEAAVKAAQARKQKLVVGARSEAIQRGRALLDEAEAMASIAKERAERGRKLAESGTTSVDETDWLRRESEAREARVRALREELTILQNETRPEDLAAAAAEMDEAERELAARKAELEKTTLRSPIAGTVVRRNMRVGEAVSSFQVEPVITVADLTHLRIRAEVDEIDIGKVRMGQSVYGESESFPGVFLHGKVIRLGRTMGRKTIRSMDPNERQDVRVREVLVDLDAAVDLPLGLRLIVSFLN